ncbi:NAD(P)H-quinone oxidoreductase [Corynebacterium kroppenstedtii]|uniref:Putative quinone oxidoreductase n=1 Tax=Corynebacterium kroppenstedtii (strain DSM 44385 / JCM 11950 / CIP 105744 / CCUG 35717) TaxID=645127 RepID=C4LLN8_CORK4|nr:NAD(P)H-quinone oxidoreductase [Corynebacterium kroppenstedtii]ACR18743.1 putative quinone oxidoreductase [Corynebacterium kroppenstedtii DSM 44385]QRP09965.1 NAD(P)H-quinone oxidoreductase [Corynebacterium kroppenstedtii]
MKAIIQQDTTDPTSLAWTDTDDPTPRPGEALVRIHAAGVNRGDVLQAAGHYPPPPGTSDIIGLEAAGTIEAFGPPVESSHESGSTSAGEKSGTQPVKQWSVGDQCGMLLAGGGYAERVAVPVTQLFPVPRGWSLTDTAGVIEVAATVWSNLGMVADMQKDQTVLIHGGSGGIGTFAIQLAHAMGLTVATTAGNADNLELCRSLGADILINYRDDDFVVVMKEHGGADIILDIMGAKYLDSNVKALGEKGHLVIIGMQGGVKGELNIGRLLSKRGSITATNVRGRSLDDKAAVVADTIKHVWPLLEDGTISAQVTKTLPIADAAEAHRLLKSREVTGKIVLTVE